MEEQYKHLADMGHSYEVKTKDLERNYEAKAKMLEEQATRAAQQRQEAMEKEITEEQSPAPAQCPIEMANGYDKLTDEAVFQRRHRDEQSGQGDQSIGDPGSGGTG